MATHGSNQGEQILPEAVPEKKLDLHGVHDATMGTHDERAADVELDAAGQFLADMAEGPDGEFLVSAYTPEEEKAVKRKADFIIVPLLFWALS